MKTKIKFDDIDIEELKSSFDEKGLSFISKVISDSQRFSKNNEVNLDIKTKNLSIENVRKIKDIAEKYKFIGLQRKASSYINALNDVDNFKSSWN